MSLPFIFVLLSAVLWAMQPAFILTAGRMIPDDLFIFLAINTFSTFAISLLFALFYHNINTIREVFKKNGLLKKFIQFVLVDSFFVAASYVLLAISAQESNLAAAAIFFESWPIFVAILLFIFSPSKEDRSQYAIFAFALFAIGLYFIHKEENISNSPYLRIDILYPILSAICMAIGVFVTQYFARKNNEFIILKNFILIIIARSFSTTIFISVIFMMSDHSIVSEIEFNYILASIVFGIVVFFNTFLYHIGVAKSQTNSISLVALLSPVLAPVFLFVIGFGLPSIEFFVGAAYIIAGLSVTARTKDNTPQFQILLIVMLLSSTLIIFIEGLSVQNYYVTIQVTSVFYALLQTSSLTRLNYRYIRAKKLALEIYSICKEGELKSNNLTISIQKNELRSIKSEVSSVSEIVLLTLFALSNIFIAIFTRENSLEGDIVAYIITIVSSFMVLICWYYQARIMRMTPYYAARLSKRPSNVLYSRIFSYVVTSSLFLWLLFIIIYKYY